MKTPSTIQTTKTPFQKLLRLLSTVAVALLALVPWAFAQTPPVLSLQLYAGLSITGVVGTVYSIEYVTDLTHTNQSDWRCLEFLQPPARFGVQTNAFGFIISWATNISVAVEACTNLPNPIWSPVVTNTPTDGSDNFSDPHWTNYRSHFYRLRSP